MSNFKLKVGASCVAPTINIVSLNAQGHLVINYSLNTTNLGSPEYQISVDENFNNIVNSKIGFPYVQEEITTLLATGYSNLYIRVRKHCIQGNVTVPSAWSTVYHWINTTQQVSAPYEFNPVAVIPADYTTPIDTNNYTICSIGNQFTKGLKIDTITPQVGTKLYLTDGITPATPGNLSSFNVQGIVDFNTNGIKWVRFIYGANNSDLYTKIWEVNPVTGVIVSLSSYTCNP